jgi:DNA-binding MarR family transcriptional regulator
MSPKDLIEHIMDSTLTISRALRQHMACHPKDANMLQMHALMYIREHKGMTMKELAGHLKITSPSATSFVNRLVKLKWVERFTDAKNRKLVRLRVSKKGEEMLQREWKQRTLHLEQVLSLVPSEDRKHLARILSSLASSIHHISPQ